MKKQLITMAIAAILSGQALAENILRFEGQSKSDNISIPANSKGLLEKTPDVVEEDKDPQPIAGISSRVLGVPYVHDQTIYLGQDRNTPATYQLGFDGDPSTQTNMITAFTHPYVSDSGWVQMDIAFKENYSGAISIDFDLNVSEGLSSHHYHHYRAHLEMGCLDGNGNYARYYQENKNWPSAYRGNVVVTGTQCAGFRIFLQDVSKTNPRLKLNEITLINY